MSNVISVSRRTDIPALYSNWFFDRVKEGYCCIKNPYNNVKSEVSLKPYDVTAFVFWTKNPGPMLNRLDEINDYHYYFQVTINPYGKDIEPGVPQKMKVIESAKNLASKIGAHRVIWRYDPIFISEKYTVEYHKKYFEEIAFRMKGCFRHCVISIVDVYSASQFQKLGIRTPTDTEKDELITHLMNVATKYGFEIVSCAETGLDKYGVKMGHCIDADIISELVGESLDLKKDKNQRKECGCCASKDIGAYNTCVQGCKYCYATHNGCGHLSKTTGDYLE